LKATPERFTNFFTNGTHQRNHRAVRNLRRLRALHGRRRYNFAAFGRDGAQQFFRLIQFSEVFLAGTLGGIVGDNVAYFIGRLFRKTIKDYRFYEMARPRIERLIDKFGSFAIIISKYIYGIRAAMCVFYGIGRMPYARLSFSM
jgi:hypothetical protein